MSNYIFGYGSLVEKESRTYTVQDAHKAFPVKVNGLTRGWWARTKVVGLSTTYLGCLPSDSEFLKGHEVMDHVNGVLFEVTEDALSMLDAREKNYKRILIDKDQIHMYQDISLKDIPVWVYVNDFEDKEDFLQSLPAKDFPIVQSYVDICINGCLEIEQDFPGAKEEQFLADFITSTSFWSFYWANDRIFPRRPHVYCKSASLIDNALKENLKDKTLFDSIYIEGPDHNFSPLTVKQIS